MEPTGTPATTTTPPGVLAAQDAIVFSGAGGEGVTPPGLAPTVAPAVAPAGTDVFWASLVQAQMCVWELQGAIEGQPDGGDHDQAPQDGQHHGHGATAGRAATAWSVSHQWCGPGSTEESISHQHVPTDGSISPKFMPMDGNISPKFTPTDGSISHKHQGHGSTYENIFHTSTGGSISHEHHGHVPADGRILPKFMPMDEIIFHEHQGSGSTCKSIFHVSTGGSISPTSMPLDKNISPKFMPIDKNISPKSTPTDKSIFHEHEGHGSAYETVFHVSTDGSVLPEHVLTDGTNSPKSMPMDGSILHKHQGWGFAYESISHMSMGGSISNEHCGHVPTDGSISPRSMSMDGSISPVSVPVDETILQEHVPIDGTISPKSVPMDGTLSPKSMPMDGTISPKPVPMDGTISQEHVPMDGTISPKAMTMDGAISPEFMPTGGTTSPEHQDPECSEEEEEDADEDEDGCSSQEEDGEEEEDLEEEEPHFHTNPLFQSQVPAPMGAQRVPLYRPHGIALQPLLITEGDDATGGTGEGRGGVCVPHTLPPFGCCPVGGDVDGAAKQGPPRSPGLALSDPLDLPPGSGDPPSPLRLQPEWGYRDPPRPPTPLELITGGGDRDTPSPGYPPGVASGGGDQDLPLPRPLTPPKPPLGGRYQPPAGPLTPPDLPQGGEYQPPHPPPDLPQRGGYPPPARSLTPPDLPQGGGYKHPPTPPDLPQKGGYPPPARPPTPPDLPQRGGYQPPARPPTPPDLPQGGGYKYPPTPPDLPQKGGYPSPARPPTPPDLPQRGGYQRPARPLTPPDLPQGGGYKYPPMPPDLPQKGGYPPPARPPTPPDLPQRGGYQPPARPSPPPDLSQRGGYQKPPSPLTPFSLPQPPPSPPYQPMRGGYQPSPNPLTPLDLPQPPPSPPTPPYHPLGGGYQPSPSALPPLDHPQPPSPLSSLLPRGPPGPGVIEGARGGPPTLGHGCAWLPASPGTPCPGGEVAQGAPPATPPPHPDTEELPPETGEEPPPDPPASTHGCPPGGSAMTPALANGGQGRRGEAQRLATRLFHLDGFKKSQVAAFLRKNNDFSGMVAQEYLDFFQFGGQTLDQALRSFLQALVLTGETQERERILGHFSRRYHRCNPGAFPSPDAVHSLTCAIMLLNTDLHGQRLGRAMTSSEFVANLSGMMDGQDFPREQLKALYGSIRSEKLAWAADEEEEEEEEAGGGGSLTPLSRKKSNPFLDLPGGAGAVTYRRGWLARKVLAEADGKKTPWGRRGWKPFQAVLRGTVLYFLKPGGRTGVPRRPPDPGPFPDPQEEEGPEAEEPLGVHHALAERASKYTKRPNVFRLQTADWRVFLFQAPTPEEMSSWISRINLVAALYSSPPFPAAVGSQRRFVRPILPAAPSRSPPEEQHRSHEAWMERVAQELFEHQRNLPEKRGRARDLDEYRLKKEYLLYERRRYETYVQVLETWISTGAQDLEGWEAQAGPVVAPPDPPTLTKAHSSPSLVPEPPVAPTIRVKRNISERRTVRKIVPKRNKNLL